MKANRIKLKPCPRCGEADFLANAALGDAEDVVQVQCLSCHMEGTMAPNYDVAAIYWNTMQNVWLEEMDKPRLEIPTRAETKKFSKNYDS